MHDHLLNKISYLNQTTVDSLRETDEKKIIRRFAESSIRIMGADFGFVWLNRKSTDANNFQLVYKSRGIPYTPKSPRPRGTTQKVIKTRKPLLVADLLNSSYLRKDANKHLKSLAIIPIVYKSQVYGSFYVCFKKKHVFTDEEKSLAEFIGTDAGQVITIHLFHKKAEKDSQKLLKQKDEFFNIASHELKTPVAAIKGFVQLLNQKVGRRDPESAYFLDKINTHTEKLSRLVNDLLDISRIETGKLKFKKSPFELCELLEEVVESMRVALPHNPIFFTCHNLFWLKGDCNHIERVLINLITNASKYSPVGSKIKVSLEKEGAKAKVSIEDFGIGISEKDRQKIFNRFFQSKENISNTALPGLGLGLYISKEILKRHKGELRVESKSKSKGSVFSFTLPYDKYRNN